MRYPIVSIALGLAMTAGAQNIQFETRDYKELGIYDTWEASPFRTGQLKGNYAVVANPNKCEANASARVLAVQRSRYGSNTFGVRIELNEPFELTPTEKYIHLQVNRPYSGRVMVVGLGKRTDRPAQPTDVEQFWAMTTADIAADSWQAVSLPIKGAGGIEIHSLVVVPDCESPHAYTTDAICYIDNILVSDKAESPYISTQPSTLNTSSTTHDAKHCLVSNTNRNGEVTLPDGTQLMSYEHPTRKALQVKVRPEAGFTHDGVVVHYGVAANRHEVHMPARKVKPNGLLKLPRRYMVGEVEIEGIFVEIAD